MTKRIPLFGILLLLALIAAACAPTAATPAVSPEMEEEKTAEMPSEQPEEMMAKETPEAMDDDHSGEETMEDDEMMTEEPSSQEMADEMLDAPGWFSAELSNVRTGETFTVSDFKGKVVLVETMAIWCSNCRRQQQNVAELHTLLGERDDFISLGLDIDPNEDASNLKDYIEANGFHWTYAVAPSQVGNELANLYGSQFLSPPSTPMLIIDKQGEVHLLPFGIKSAEDLQAALEPFLSEDM